MPSTRGKARKFAVSAGHPQPLGATCRANGVNFSVFSEHATAMQLLLFASDDDPQPEHVVDLDPEVNHSFHFWHCHVAGLGAGQLYAYRMDGPQDASRPGCGSTRTRCCIDPYARGNVNDRCGTAVDAVRARRQRGDRRCAASSSTPTTTTGRATSRCDRPLARHGHLRDARPRLHPARRAPASSDPRHLRRA